MEQRETNILSILSTFQSRSAFDRSELVDGGLVCLCGTVGAESTRKEEVHGVCQCLAMTSSLELLRHWVYGRHDDRMVCGADHPSHLHYSWAAGKHSEAPLVTLSYPSCIRVIRTTKSQVSFQRQHESAQLLTTLGMSFDVHLLEPRDRQVLTSGTKTALRRWHVNFGHPTDEALGSCLNAAVGNRAAQSAALFGLCEDDEASKSQAFEKSQQKENFSILMVGGHGPTDGLCCYRSVSNSRKSSSRQDNP